MGGAFPQLTAKEARSAGQPSLNKWCKCCLITGAAFATSGAALSSSAPASSRQKLGVDATHRIKVSKLQTLQTAARGTNAEQQMELLPRCKLCSVQWLAMI